MMNLFGRISEKKFWEILSWAQKEEARYLQSGDVSALERAATNVQRILNHPAITSQSKKLKLNAFYDASRILFRRYGVMGKPADLDQSIAAGRQAIMMTSPSSPEWIACANNLGAELRDRYRRKGDLTDLEQSISLYREVLKATSKELLDDRAMYLNNLGSSLLIRYQRLGQVPDLDESISLCEQATKQTPPNATALPARLVNLGLALRDRSVRTGDIADLERAILAFEQAIAQTPSQTPELSLYLNNLGLGLNDRYELMHNVGDLERTIWAYEQAIAHAHPDAPDLPLYLANLGRALVNRHSLRVLVTGDMTDLERSVRLFEQASERSLPASYDYCRNLSFMSAAFINKYQSTGDRAALERAIHLVEQIVAQTPRSSPSLPSDLNALGNALRMRYQYTRNKADLELSIHAYKRALEECGQDIAAEAGLANARDWGDWAFERQAWGESIQAFRYGQKAVERLFHIQLLRPGKEAWLHEARNLYTQTAYALARSGDNPAAVATLEQGRARLLGEILERNRSDLEKLQTLGHAGLYHRYRKSVDRAAQLESANLRQENLPATFKFAAELRAARTEVDEAIKAIQEVPGYADFFRPLNFEQIQRSLAISLPNAPELVTGIYLVLTSLGGLALIVHVNGVQCVWLDFTEKDLADLLIPHQDAGSYLLGQLGIANLPGALDHVLPLIGEKIMRPIANALDDILSHSDTVQIPHSVILIPTGRLALLPLHAATYQGRSFLDDFVVSYTPSARALSHSRDTLESLTNDSPSLFAVGNPLPSPQTLPFARAEVEGITSFFGNRAKALYEKDAIRTAVEPELGINTYLHFACHGEFNPAKPLESGLMLSNGEMLTLRELLAHPHFGETRLAVLSACQTAITDFNNLPDEAIGLPAGMMQAGAPGVIGTLWPVVDSSTKLLMIKFYEFHLKYNLAPASALRNAQLWLKELTRQQFVDYCSSNPHITDDRWLMEKINLEIKNEDPGSLIFSQPYYWAAFTFSGM